VETSPEAASPEGLPPAIGSKIESVLAQLRRRRDGQEKPIQTPWSDLNEQLGGGWWPGVHVLISGTGAGKSQLVIEAGTDAAAEGRAVIGYAALELDDVGILSRVAARLAMRDNRALSWSAVSRGEVNPDDDVMVRAFQRMSNLPFHLDTGSTVGWSVSNLETMARSLREANPGKPLLLVVDFLQLVAGDRDSREDARSRIGRVAYQARGLARDLQAAIVLVSSTARQNYNLFANDSGFPPAGLRLDGTRRSILSPDMLVGLGKETGEIEYAADSVTVMGRIPRDRFPSGPDGFGPVLLATAKLRAGPPSWCVLGSNGQTFRPWSAEENQAVLDALAPPDKTKRKTGEAKPKATATTNDDDDDYVIPPCLQG
jgi:replicative DNA helicase